MDKDLQGIKDLLDFKAELYERQEFIVNDPVSVPHQFSLKEDIEISAFLAAILSWGQRKTILSKSRQLMQLMDYDPYNFIMNASDSDLNVFKTFTHRTFNGIDCIFFIKSLKNIYIGQGGLETLFKYTNTIGVRQAIIDFRRFFLAIPHPLRSEKHLPDPSSGSSAKRINMFLRWMVRQDSRGVDFGIWKSVSLSKLYCPLDIHSGHVARKLGLIKRNQNDWLALEELMTILRQFDPEDPVKYDFALFGLGIFEKF